MRTYLILTAVVAILIAGLTVNSGILSSDNETLQKVFQGIWAQNNLPGPYMVKYCFDQTTSHDLVVFIGELLEKAARGSVSDLLKLIQIIKETIPTLIPPATIQCLGRTQEVYILAIKYNIDPSTDFQTLDLHIAEYIALHYLEVHRWTGDLNDKWKAGKYYENGYALAGYIHKIVNFP